MKIAVLADIHGNIAALDAILKEIKELKINKILIAGDFIGYYYRIKDILNRLAGLDIIACRGNHEDLLKEWIYAHAADRIKLKKKYGRGFEIAEEELSAIQKEWLLSLKHPVFFTLANKKFCLSHGSPWDINQYIYKNKFSEVASKFKKYTDTLHMIILGHTHYQFSHQIDNCKILNPGSVGQPRSGKIRGIIPDNLVRAQWAIINVSTLEVQLKTTLYNAFMLLQETIKNDPENNYLRSVLYRQ